MSLLNTMTRMANSKPKHNKQATTPSSDYITLVVSHNNAKPQSVRRYASAAIESATLTGIQIVRQNRASKCAIFGNDKTKLVGIERAGLMGNQVKITRHFGTTKTRQVLKNRELRDLGAE